MTKILLTNYEDYQLYCYDCKRKIMLGEKYCVVYEKIYNDQEIEKFCCLDCIPEEDDVYIGEQE